MVSFSRVACCLALLAVAAIGVMGGPNVAAAPAAASPTLPHSPTPRTVPTIGDPTSTNHPAEHHHSLTTPLDQSSVYWNFGGSTVSTRKFVRLTPSVADRRGWLWNEYPLEAENWEVEFKMEVFSKPHFGGDGMAFWVLTGDHDPAFNTDPDALSGSVFGMRNDFQGFGVMFDVYDNDNRRDNPGIFVLKNDNGAATTYNHDNDYQNDMYKKTAVVDNTKVANYMHTQYRCLGEFRNTGKPAKVLVKYLHKNLHVYIDTSDGVGYKFCLAVALDKSYKDYHLAFSAATGQVADNHDIIEVTTRYLAASDAEFDDSSLPQLNATSSSGGWGTFFWAIIIIIGGGLSVLSMNELYQMSQLKHIDSVHVCEQLNKLVVPHYALHWFLTVALLAAGPKWIPLLLNAPLAVYRAVIFSKKQHTLNPSLVAQQNHNVRLYSTIAVYVISELLYLHAFSQ